MYDSLSSFLKTFSAEFPILWALIVLVVVAGTGVFLYGFWELVLRLAAPLFGSRPKNTHRNQG